MAVREDIERIDSVVVLRAEIRRLRSALERSQQDAEPIRNVDSVTEHLALQQEVDTLRHSMHEKDRVIESTADQCRRVEDELEDQRLAYDGLKQDLERKKQSLAAAREQSARLSRERHELEERYQALIDLNNSVVSPESTVGDDADPVSPEVSPKRLSVPFVLGLVSGTLIATAAGVILTLTGLLSSIVPVGQPDTADDPTQPTAQSPQTPETPSMVVEIGNGKEQADAETSSKDIPIVIRTRRDRLRDGSSGPLMAALKAGEFTMGKPTTIPSDNQGPAHRVTLHSYMIGVNEVTFDDYDRFVRATGYRSPDDFGWGRGRRPVVDVSWNDAMAYANWLSKQTGRRYRLPSEAEWEYAASAGERSPFWWGYQPGEGRAVCFDCGSQWDRRSTAPAASFKPSPIGLYDTAGNAMEWVSDCYHPNYDGAPADGRPWITNDCGFRIARGGAFNKPARSMGRTVRNRFDPETRLNMLGFRLARDE